MITPNDLTHESYTPDGEKSITSRRRFALTQEALRRWGVLVLGGALGVALLANWQSLGEGVAYGVDMVTYRPMPDTPLDRNGRYAALYHLITLNNAERSAYLEQWLTRRNITPTAIPIPDSPQVNWLVRLGPPGPYTLFVAHWDKQSERPAYQGAADNTSGVVVLLAAVEALAARPPERPVAFLWTGEEERGLRGAQAFVHWAHASGFDVAHVYNFDMLGRGGLVARPVADSAGFVFSVPLVGRYVYDGRALRPAPPFQPIDTRVAQTLRRAQPKLQVARMMTATGDTNIFEAAGWPGAVISASNIHFLNLTWHSDADRVELLDEGNLDLAYQLILNLAR